MCKQWCGANVSSNSNISLPISFPKRIFYAGISESSGRAVTIGYSTTDSSLSSIKIVYTTIMANKPQDIKLYSLGV